MSNTENGLVLYLKMDEISNVDQALDSSDTGNDGTLINNVTLASDSTFGNCLNFDGNTTYVDLGDYDVGGALAGGSTAFSIMTWIKPTALNNAYSNHDIFNVFFSKAGKETNDNLELGIRASGNLGVYIDLINEDKTSKIFGSGELTVDNWHYVAVVFDSGTLTVYLDGQLYEQSYSKNATELDDATGSSIVAGGTNNSDIYFTGDLAHLRVYDRALTADEVMENMENDPVSSASFRVSYPLDFSLTDEQGDQTLYIDETPGGLNMELTVSNSAAQAIELTAGTGTVGADNFHFELVFRPGTLSDATLSNIAISEENWDLSYDTESDGTTSLYFLSTASVSLEISGILPLTLTSISADPGQGTRGTKVEFNYQQMVYSGENTELTGSRVQTLSVVNHTGEKFIPWHVGFIGSNAVLNDGSASSTVTLRITNISDDAITLSTTDPTQLIFNFDVETEVGTKPWALTSSANAENIVFSASSEWTNSVDKSGESPVWTLKNETLTSLASGDHIELTLSDIVTDLDSGTTNLYLRYENVPGYWDGQFVITIEKAPLLYRGENVGIGTSTPGIQLAIGDSNTGLAKVADNTLGVYTDGTQQLHLDSTGNLGIGLEAEDITEEVTDVETGTVTEEPKTLTDKLVIKNGGMTLDTDVQGVTFSGGSKIYEDSGQGLMLETPSSTIDINLNTNTIISGNVDISGNTNVDGAFSATGAGNFANGLSITGNTTMSGNASLSGTFTSDLSTNKNLSVTKDATISGNATVSGDTAVSGNSTIDGNLTVKGTLGKQETDISKDSDNSGSKLKGAGYKQLGNFMIQWGTCTLDSDNEVTFPFPTEFATTCWSVVLTRTGEGYGSPINVNTFTKKKFSVKRDGSIDGKKVLAFLAVGDCIPDDV